MKSILAFLLLCLPCIAETVAIRTQGNCGPFGCQMGAGSGVVIGKTQNGHYVIATAKHVIANQTKAWISVADRWVQASQIYPLPGQYDAAFLMVSYDGDLEIVEVAEEDPAPGEAMVFSGFSGGTRFEKGRGKVESLGQAITSPGVKHGQSGGGVYDAEGRLIGIVNAYDTHFPQRLIYAPMGEVRKVCLRHWKMFWGRCRPRRPAPVPTPIPDMGDPTPLPDAPPPLSGRDGKDGKDGRDGKDADEALIVQLSQTVNQLQAALEANRAELSALKLKKIPVQILRPDGSIFDQAEYELGKPIKLQLAPIDRK